MISCVGFLFDYPETGTQGHLGCEAFLVRLGCVEVLSAEAFLHFVVSKIWILEWLVACVNFVYYELKTSCPNPTYANASELDLGVRPHAGQPVSCQSCSTRTVTLLLHLTGSCLLKT